MCYCISYSFCIHRVVDRSIFLLFRYYHIIIIVYELLKKYDSEKINIDKDELEENKDRIVETLGNYNIKISSIKATVGPTVTLYEIIPDAGVRISKIKNLEDDIALSLSALGIRIIAPIPGRGTIGIEVPNKNSTIVSMHSVISSEKFQQSEMELPIAIGKTISNETLVVDLVKMPHLLMAGATGQGGLLVIKGNAFGEFVIRGNDIWEVRHKGNAIWENAILRRPQLARSENPKRQMI